MEKVNAKKLALERTKIFHQNEIHISPIKSIHENVLTQVNTELKCIKSPIEPKMVSFDFDSYKMSAELNNLGKLFEIVRSRIDYKSKKQPLVSVCEKGKGMGQLYYHRDLTVDNRTRNIFIADQSSACVKVFDSTGNYLFKFGDNADAGKIDLPLSVAICVNRILISQYYHCILNYPLNGKFISKIGKYGNRKLEFNCPIGLTIDESNGDNYVSDCYNNRIQILFQDFRFISQFGKDTLKYTRDVKLSKEYIFVLDGSNPCLHLFNYNHILQKSVIS